MCMGRRFLILHWRFALSVTCRIDFQEQSIKVDQVTNQLQTRTGNLFPTGQQQGITIQQRQPFSVNAAQQGQLQNPFAMNIMNATNSVSSESAVALVRTFYYLWAIYFREVSRTLSNICLIEFLIPLCRASMKISDAETASQYPTTASDPWFSSGSVVFLIWKLSIHFISPSQ